MSRTMFFPGCQSTKSDVDRHVFEKVRALHSSYWYTSWRFW
jgi:hypothetical protein